MTNEPSIALIVIRAQNMDKLAEFYSTLGCVFTKHRHGNGPEHLSCTLGETVFEIYPAKNANESTAATRLGFSVPSIAAVLARARELGGAVLTEPSDTPFGRRAVIRDFEGHKIELYEKATKAWLISPSPSAQSP